MHTRLRPEQTHACKFCGAIVVVEADKARAYHASPTCEAFRKHMESAGAKRGGQTMGVVVKAS